MRMIYRHEVSVHGDWHELWMRGAIGQLVWHLLEDAAANVHV